MLRTSIIDAAQAMQARVCAVENSRLSPISDLPEVSIDTRSLKPGQCFFAIRGPRFDGHDFLAEALAKGASAVVLSQAERIESSSSALFLLVEDTTRALQQLAAHLRQRWGGPLLAVTGSAGKTTTRAFCAALLARRFQVHQSQGNLNNEYGVPLSLFGLRSEHQFVVQELGMNHAGEIRRLGEICRPTAALLTNVAPVHLEFFKDLDDIARAKAEVLESLPRQGCFFYNADDQRVSTIARGFAGLSIAFGLDNEADVQIVEPSFLSPFEMTFALKSEDQQVPMKVRFAGWHALYNVAAAAAVALHFGVGFDEIGQAVEQLELPEGRGRLFEAGGVQIWDDSYNSNPRALQLVLRSLMRLPRPGRTVLALGDMLELGEDSKRLHYQCGEEAARVAPDLLVTVGDHARHLSKGAHHDGIPSARCLHFEDAESAAVHLTPWLHQGDFVLVKGSRGIHMEKIVEALRAQLGVETTETV